MVKWIGRSTKPLLKLPQGDKLSPILFTVYLEAALRIFMSKVTNHVKLNHSYTHLQPFTQSKMVGYADDLDFIGRDKQQLLNLANKLEDVFSNWNLEVNTDKTDLIKMSKPQNA